MNFRITAHVLSFVLHPLLIPSFFFLTIFYTVPYTIGSSNQGLVWNLLLIVFLVTFLIPSVSILLLYTLGVVKSLKMEDKRDRQVPFIFTSVFYIAASYLFIFQITRLPILGVTMASTTVCLIFITIITFYWKISAHSVGISGALGFLVALAYLLSDKALLMPILITVFLAGCLMSARLYLQAHTPEQILAGASLGFIVSVLSVILFF